MLSAARRAYTSSAVAAIRNAALRPTSYARHCTPINKWRTFPAATRGLHASIPRLHESESHALPPPPPGSQPSGPIQIEQRLQITFTCTVEDCGHRSSHEFTKRSYEKGIVIVQCPGCKNRHLIADHLGWFKDVTDQGQQRTIEDIMRAKGETVKKGQLDAHGEVLEFTPPQ